MFRCVEVLCVLLWCAGVSTGLQCVSPHSSAFKFSINSRRNLTGHWIAQLQVQHEAEKKVAGPWEVDIDHTTAKCEDTESVQIFATITAPPLAPKGPPASGYNLVSGLGYYKLHTNLNTWNEALKACEAEGAHLAVINSEEEAKALGVFWDMNPNIVDGAKNNWAHIGFHDQYKEGEYLTIFNTSQRSTGYIKWSLGEPNGVGHNCGCVFRRENLLGDIPCGEKQPFFCEKEL